LSRIIHIHENIPGMMQKINNVFYQRDMNILGVWLQTNATIGYTVLDLNSIDNPTEIVQELENIMGTIRTKII